MYDTLNDMKKKALILKGTCESWILSECQMLKIKINKHEENNTEIDIKFVLKYMLCNTSDLITSQKTRRSYDFLDLHEFIYRAVLL